MALDITEGGVRWLAVPVGPARGTALTRILSLKGSPGWLVAPPSIKEWRFTGVTERADGALLYGPWHSGRTLASVLDLPADEVLTFLARLTEALALLEERLVPLFPLQTDAVIFCDDGSILFLPAEVTRELRELRPFEMNRETFESLRNPDLRGEDAVSFSLGVLLYRRLTGAFPFTGPSPEELHEQMRKLEILGPADVMPGIPEDVSETIMAALGRSRRRAPSLEDWLSSLRSWHRAGALRSLARIGAPSRAAESRRRESERRFRRRVFWEKNWRTALIITVAVAVAGAGLASVLKGVLAPRVTRGYSPEKVVRTFYQSMNTLDTVTMQACVVGGAGKEEINEVTNLYVISRVSMGYEGRSNIIAADDWDRAGRPAVPAPRTIYGVTGLSIVQEKPAPTPVFRVSYEKWNPVPASDETGSKQPPTPRYEGHSIVDRVSLKKDRGDWVIDKIDRLHVAPVSNTGQR